MIRCLRPLLLALGLATTAAAAATAPVQGEQLEQVVLLSRHNLRARRWSRRAPWPMPRQSTGHPGT